MNKNIQQNHEDMLDPSSSAQLIGAAPTFCSIDAREQQVNVAEIMPAVEVNNAAAAVPTNTPHMHDATQQKRQQRRVDYGQAMRENLKRRRKKLTKSW